MKNRRSYIDVYIVLTGLAFVSALGTIQNAKAQDVAVDKVQILDGYRLKFSLDTNAQKSTIWRLWSDVENWKKFDTLLEYSQLDDGHEFELGATGVIKAEGARKTRFKLTEFREGKSFTETLYVPLYQQIELKRYFEQSEQGGTRFSHEVVFKGRLRWLIYLAAAGTFKKELPLVMGRLKDLAELEESRE